MYVHDSVWVEGEREREHPACDQRETERTVGGLKKTLN